MISPTREPEPELTSGGQKKRRIIKYMKSYRVATREHQERSFITAKQFVIHIGFVSVFCRFACASQVLNSNLRVNGLGGFAVRDIAGTTYPSPWSNLLVGCDAAQEERRSKKELVFV